MNEQEIVKKLVNDVTKYNMLNDYLLQLMLCIVDKFGHQKQTFLSKNTKELHNIGDEPELVQYMFSPKSTISEKLTAINNAFVHKDNKLYLYNYIMKNKNKNSYIENRYNQLILYDVQTDSVGFMCQGYQNKKEALKNIVLNKNYTLNIQELETKLSEPLTEINKQFLFKNNNELKFNVGYLIYKDNVIYLPEMQQYKKLNYEIASGLSGHSLTFFDMALLCEMSPYMMFYCLCIKLVPLHHSIVEIMMAMKDLYIIDKISNPIDFFENMMIYLT